MTEREQKTFRRNIKKLNQVFNNDRQRHNKKIKSRHA